MRKIVKFGKKKIGRAFQVMMNFVTSHRVIELVAIGETHTFPGRTDKLVLRMPKGPKIRRVHVVHRRKK